MKYTTLLAILLTCVLGISSAKDASERIPLEILFAATEYSSPKISPDGTTLAVIAPIQGVKNIALIDLASKKTSILTQEKSNIGRFGWINNDRLLFSHQGETGDQYGQFSGGVYAVNKDGKKFKTLRAAYGADTGTMGWTKKGGYDNWQYLGTYGEETKYIMVSANGKRGRYPDVELLNIHTGRRKLHYKNPADFRGFGLDTKGEVRFAADFNEDDPNGRGSYYFRDPKTDEWIKVWTTSYDTGEFNIISYDTKTKKLLVSTNEGRDTVAWFWMDPYTKKLDENPVFEDERYDLGTPIYGFIDDNRVIGVSYNADKSEIRYFSNEHQKLQDLIDGVLPGMVNRVVSTDDNAKKLIIRSYSDVKFPRYYLLNLETMAMDVLFTSNPKLEKYELHSTIPISFKASDGLPIEGYLTLPNDRKDGEKVPLLVHPHGGPWARDNWGQTDYFSVILQYFADRGYAVLQVNFRTSTGYGDNHLKKGFKHLDDIHQDIIDGVKWTIDNGYVDPAKIGVMGASFGGYETMVCLTKNPDMFQFGINFMGVVDIPEQIRTYRQWDRDAAYYYWLKRMGDPADKEERVMLEEYSAINYIDKIQAPVFVYHGKDDFNVDIEQAYMLISALKKHHKEFSKVLRVDESHSTFNEQDRIALYQEIDKFLLKHGFIN